ncbi:AAA family ATPase [Brucella ciceri]|uniref:AAA family ATPase n=1 Tax=Brucella ciceri TaxID=391287 RepID=UPI001F137557|nr:AAA family ATPase [Brucella ciceri]MCH6206353.1 AAA family ATPase [Brucella ciceri]
MTAGVSSVHWIGYLTKNPREESDTDRLDEVVDFDAQSDIIEQDLEALRKSNSLNQAGVSYYEAGTSDTNGGTFFRPDVPSDTLASLTAVREGSKPKVGNGLRILDGVKSGEKLSTAIVRRLAEGYDPSTGEILAAKTAKYFNDLRRHPEKMLDEDGKPKKLPRIGDDITFSIDKPISVIWAWARLKGNHKVAKQIENLIEQSAAKAMQAMYDAGQIQTRRAIKKPLFDENGQPVINEKTGKQKTETIEYMEPVKDFVAAIYLHQTARPTGDGSSRGDPQLHAHFLLMKSAIRQDGTVGAIENNSLYYMRPVMDGLFKTAMVEGLQKMEEFRHLDFEMGEKGLKIKAKDQQLFDQIVDHFSSRSREIDNSLEDKGLDRSNRKAADVAAKDTRGSKDDQPPVEELEGDWAKGFEKFLGDNDLMVMLSKREVLKETREEKIDRVAQNAIKRLGNHRTIIREVDVLAETSRACVGEFTFDEVKEVVHHIKQHYLYIAEPDQDMRIQWAVKHLAHKEVRFLLDIKKAPVMKPIRTMRQIKAVLQKMQANFDADPKNNKMLNEEQVGMYKYILTSRQQVICVEGSAGTGKTFSMSAVHEAVKDAGMTMIGLSPSWKAAGILRDDLGLANDKFFATAKFIAQHRAGKIKIDANTVIVVDEAGMCGIEHAQYILKVVKDAGARLILQGDRFQLSPVSAGDPLSIAMRLTGGYRLNNIVRQSNNATEETKRLTARMREASGYFVKSGLEGLIQQPEGSRDDADNPNKKSPKFQGDQYIAKALGIYHEEGRIIFSKTAGDAYEEVARRYVRNAKLEQGNLQESLVVTNRNSDVHALNRNIRRAMIKAGYFGDIEVEIDAYRRDEKEDTIGHKLKLRAGERVIFGGKQFTVDAASGMQINNSDMATVERVTPRKGQEPLLHLRFDKTDKHPEILVVVTPSQLAAEDRFSDRKPLPVLQHAYAVTVHAAQGTTVNRCIVANINGIDYRLAYVGLTRHRHDAEMVVNVGRMEVNALVKQGLIIREENGNLYIPHPEGKEDIVIPEDEYKLTEEDYMNRLIFEASTSESKSNFTDIGFYKTKDGLEQFLGDRNRFRTHIEKLREQGRLTEADLERRILNNKTRLEAMKAASVAGVLKKEAEASRAETVPVQKLSDIAAEFNAKPFVTRNTKAQTEANYPSPQPTTEELIELKRRYNVTENTMTKMRLEDEARAAAIADSNNPDPKAGEMAIDVKWTPELEGEYRLQIETFMIEHGAVPNPTKRSTANSLAFCDSVTRGKPENVYNMSRMKDGNWIYNQWNDGSQSGRLETWLIKKGVVNDYLAAEALLAEKFPLHAVRNGQMKNEALAMRIVQDQKPKEIWAAYEHSIKQQTSVSSFKPGYGDMDRLDKLHQAIEEGKLSGAFGDVEKRARIAEKWNRVLVAGLKDDATEKEIKRADAALEMINAGKTIFEYEWKHVLEESRITDKYPKERALDRTTMLVFKNDVRRSAFYDHSSKDWKDGLSFAHRDVIRYGTVTGIEAKLPPATTRSGQEAMTSSFSQYGGKGVAMLGFKKSPEIEHVVICESGVDAMSHWQKNHLPADAKDWTIKERNQFSDNWCEKNKTLYLSVSGGMSSVAEEAIEILAKKNPNARFTVAMDNDLAGYGFRDKAMAAIERGNPQAEANDASLSIFYKDWNDAVKADAGKLYGTVRWPADIDKDVVQKVMTMATDRPHELLKVSDKDLDRYKSANLVAAAKEFKAQHPHFDDMRNAAYEKVGIAKENIRQWEPEGFRDTGFSDKQLAYIQTRRQEVMDKQKEAVADQRRLAEAVTNSEKKTVQTPAFTKPDFKKPAKVDVSKPTTPTPVKSFTRPEPEKRRPDAARPFGRPAGTIEGKVREAESKAQAQAAAERERLRREAERAAEKEKPAVAKF